MKEQKLTIGVDLGDRWSLFCVLDEAGKIILEQKVAMTPEAMKQNISEDTREVSSPWRPEHIHLGSASCSELWTPALTMLGKRVNRAEN